MADGRNVECSCLSISPLDSTPMMMIVIMMMTGRLDSTHIMIVMIVMMTGPLDSTPIMIVMIVMMTGPRIRYVTLLKQRSFVGSRLFCDCFEPEICIQLEVFSGLHVCHVTVLNQRLFRACVCYMHMTVFNRWYFRVLCSFLLFSGFLLA